MKVERKNWDSVLIIFGSPADLETQYAEFVNLLQEYGGRVHGSQYKFGSEGQAIAIFYTIPKDNIDEFKKEYYH